MHRTCLPIMEGDKVVSGLLHIFDRATGEDSGGDSLETLICRKTK